MTGRSCEPRTQPRHLGCPVLGVKVGRLGFLTEVEPDDAPPLIRAVLTGRARIEERLAVTVEPVAGADFQSQWGLNEVMVEKHARHRLVRLAVEVDGTYVTTFSADGVIVATPDRVHGVLVLRPRADRDPRGGLTRADADRCRTWCSTGRSCSEQVSHVQLEVMGEESGVLSADGRQSIELPVGSTVRIRASARPARLVRRDDAPDFLSLVREKFGLPGEPGERPGDTGNDSDVGSGG